MHISVDHYDSLDRQYSNCQSRAFNIADLLSRWATNEMSDKSAGLPANGVSLKKIVLQQRFVGFDINVPSQLCTPINYNQICGILNEERTEWNMSYPRNHEDWFEAINRNNTRALVLESKQWLADIIEWTLEICLFINEETSLGGFIIDLNTDDYSGKCYFKEYPYLKMR